MTSEIKITPPSGTPLTSLEDAPTRQSPIGESTLDPTTSQSGEVSEAVPSTPISTERGSGEVQLNPTVEQLIDAVFDDPIIHSAPEEISIEIRKIFTALLETEPHLQALVHHMRHTS